MRNRIKWTTGAVRLCVAALVIAGLTLFMPAPVAQAANATHLQLSGVAATASAGNTIDQFTVEALDAANSHDLDYSGTVTFSAACGDCFDVSGRSAPFTPLVSKQFAFDASMDGQHDLFIRWKAAAIGTTTLHVSGTLTPSGTADADAPNPTVVSSNAATVLDLQNVDTAPTANTADAIDVVMKNSLGESGADYTGVVTFSASCGDCFTISPHNIGAGNEKVYNFVSADKGSKAFSLTWAAAAVAASPNTFTATATNPVPATTDHETVSGITVSAVAPTSSTSTSTSTSTTSTTLVRAAARPMFVTGAGPGGGPHVIVRAADNGVVLYSFYAYAANFTGGVRVASGDVNNDGYDDIITAPGPGGGPHVRIFSGKTGQLIHEFMAYDTSFTGGVFVAAADVNGDGKADIVTGPDAGGGPHVKIFNGNSSLDGSSSNLLGQFMAYPTSFHGGVRVAAGDFDADGRADIVTGAGPGGGPHVRVLKPSGAEVPGLPAGGFFAYSPSFTGGVYVAADPANSAVIFTGAGAGGGRHVRIFGIDAAEELGFIAGGANEGAIPAVGRGNTSAGDIFLLSRAVTNPGVQLLSGNDGHQINSFPAYGAAVGVFVAVGIL